MMSNDLLINNHSNPLHIERQNHETSLFQRFNQTTSIQHSHQQSINREDEKVELSMKEVTPNSQSYHKKAHEIYGQLNPDNNKSIVPKQIKERKCTGRLSKLFANLIKNMYQMPAMVSMGNKYT